MNKKKNYSIKLFDTTDEYILLRLLVELNYTSNPEIMEYTDGTFICLGDYIIPVKYTESDNIEYNGEMYYAYDGGLAGEAYFKVKVDKGIYHTTFYSWENNEMIDNGMCVVVSQPEFIMPSVAYCKENNRALYDRNLTTFHNEAEWAIDIYDSTDNLLCSVPVGEKVKMYIPDDGVLKFKGINSIEFPCYIDNMVERQTVYIDDSRSVQVSHIPSYCLDIALVYYPE